MSLVAGGKDIEFLKELLEELETENDLFPVEELGMVVGDDARANQERNDLLWQVLSHPRSKVRSLKLEEISSSALAVSEVTKVIKIWCTEIRATAPRTLALSLYFMGDEGNANACMDLRDALAHPNNGVNELIIDVILTLELADLFVRPMLESPANVVTELRLKQLSSLGLPQAQAIARGLASSSCNVRMFEMNLFNISTSAVRTIFDGLKMNDGLESLVLDFDYRKSSDEQKDIIFTGLASVVDRPENQLKSLAIRVMGWSEGDCSALAKVVSCPTSQLTALDCLIRAVDVQVAFPLLAVLRSSDNRLTSLAITLRDIHGCDVADALRQCLTDPNCKLESLAIRSYNKDRIDGLAAIAIANVLATLDSCQLRKLKLDHQPPTVFRAFTASLLSSSNKLAELYIKGENQLTIEDRRRFYQALRRSAVLRFSDKSATMFSAAFHNPFFPVLHTLLSIKHVPRLGRSAWVRLVPLQDLIFQIAETLGWPLDLLSCN